MKNGWWAFVLLLAFVGIAMVGDEMWWMIRRWSYKTDRWFLYAVLFSVGYAVGSLRR